MKNVISINKYLLVGLITAALAGGSYAGFYYTSEHYKEKEASDLRKEAETDEKSLICEARVQRGKTADIKSDYFIFERSAKEEDCKKFIDYKNMPDNTEGAWLGF
ncbi:TPA: hypothetical protein DDX46_02660 [Candidatus Saccharibacteria bacterium]|nr:MAG: hypothetical protein UW38_C0001G0352 [Candidatus Saccharibacteria bacterium GW2011_GWC2_44_17]MBH1956100.1 hypothetical protein [Candidatus Saccharibacteria bacterium]OGL33173.1 MAG: hypothetical protein A3E20_01015 [Candidatus Saccharibacteria bacterium RIFCSPHIGHO2_12_FULL_47_16]MBH1972488.1 hypothetical protein [Candidatus Saccharibacteria bacterium]MBH1990170.1 hypothetical protein [Candidatus Saccharibacteria bacterium]